MSVPFSSLTSSFNYGLKALEEDLSCSFYLSFPSKAFQNYKRRPYMILHQYFCSIILELCSPKFQLLQVKQETYLSQDVALQVQNLKPLGRSSDPEEYYEAKYQNVEFAHHSLDAGMQLHELLQEIFHMFSHNLKEHFLL